MKCPICDHENSDEAFLSRSANKATCPQCEVDLESISLLSKLDDTKVSPLKQPENMSFSLSLSIVKTVLFAALLLICGKALLLFSDSLEKKGQLEGHLKVQLSKIQLELKRKDKTFLEQKKKFHDQLIKVRSELEKNKNQHEESLKAIKHKIAIVKKESLLNKNRSENKELTTQLVFYDGKDSLWKFSSKVYGHGRYFPLLFTFNPKLMSVDNKAQFLRILTNSKQMKNIYNKRLYFSKSRKAYYRYTSYSGDTLSKIMKRFSGVLYGTKATIKKLNKKMIYTKNTIKPGQKIILQFR